MLCNRIWVRNSFAQLWSVYECKVNNVLRFPIGALLLAALRRTDQLMSVLNFDPTITRDFVTLTRLASVISRTSSGSCASKRVIMSL
jgi:hypothetical protein